MKGTFNKFIIIFSCSKLSNMNDSKLEVEIKDGTLNLNMVLRMTSRSEGRF